MVSPGDLKSKDPAIQNGIASPLRTCCCRRKLGRMRTKLSIVLWLRDGPNGCGKVLCVVVASLGNFGLDQDFTSMGPTRSNSILFRVCSNFLSD